MDVNLRPWQIVVLMVFFPAVGAFFVCTSGAKPWVKAAALIYCAAVALLLMTLRRPTGDIIINAVPLT